jgi:hypothetical protein
MKSIVPEALLSSGAAAGTYPDQTSSPSGPNLPAKETARRAEALRAEDMWTKWRHAPPLAIQLFVTAF